MKKSNRLTLYKLIWCKIRYFQQLYGITDEKLAQELSVHARTLKEYDKDAKNITLGKIDSFLYMNNISLDDLIKS